MMFKKLITVLFLVCVFHGAAHAQIPVTDALGLQQQLAQVAQWTKQIAAMKQQYEQLKNTFESLNGLRDIGGLMKNELLAQALPTEFQDAYNLLKSGQGGNLAGISGTLNQIVSKYQAQGCQNQTASELCKQAWQALSMNQFVAETGYNQAAKNIQNLENFVNAIKQAPDQKSINDLAARIQVEQVKMQNEAIKLQTVQLMQKAQDDIRRQNQAESTNKSLQSNGFIRF
jgi:type IV secretion system protein VirB5